MYKSTQVSTANWSNVVFFIGRFLVGGFYLYAGINNLLGLNEKIGYAMFKGVPFPMLSIILASSLLLLGGMSILTGYRPAVGVGAVILFLVPVTLMMHNFWTIDDPQTRVTEMRSFLSNMALAGSALLLVGVPQPWTWSVDAWAAKAKGIPNSWMLSPTAK
jgi:uncharacterized membrane protein YphA (DoxX/SURF4 family)